MKFGSWIHSHGDLPLEQQIELAAQQGLETIRSYHFDYARTVAPTLERLGLSLLGGMHVNSELLASDWRSQVHLDELSRYHELGVTLEAICVGNELREGGDEPQKKRFTARLSYNLTRLLETYRHWLDQRGYATRLTYAMEGIVFDSSGDFNEWVTPLIEVCDVVSVNHYPMGNCAWFTFDAFEESRRFLYEGRTRNLRLAAFDLRLRRTLEALSRFSKPLILTETGFPSAIGYRVEGKSLVVPVSDHQRYGELMEEFVGLIGRVNIDYNGQILAIYLYEWRDNLHHSKIWNVEQSPIHVAFGLCDRFGNPKFDISKVTRRTR